LKKTFIWYTLALNMALWVFNYKPVRLEICGLSFRLEFESFQARNFTLITRYWLVPGVHSSLNNFISKIASVSI